MFQKWCELTSCNGVIDLYEARNDKKKFSFWVIIMLTSFGGGVWFTYKTIKGFIETPIVTNVGTVDSYQLDMPEILLSYEGGFNVATMREANLSEEFIHIFSSSFNFQTNPVGNVTAANEELHSFMKRENLGYEGVVMKFGYTCEEMVKFIYSAYTKSTKYCQDAQLYLLDRARSYAFKNLPPQGYPGIWGGLKLVLTAPKNSYILTYPDKVYAYDMNHQYSITLEKTVGSVLSKREYLIPLDTEVAVTLRTKRYVRVNGTRRCSSSEALYTSNTCYFTCFADELKRANHNCTPVINLGNNVTTKGLRICNPLFYKFGSGNSSQVEDCRSKCIPLCDEWVFETTLAYSSLSPLSLNESIAIVKIGYNTMEYIKIEEVMSFTIDMAVSNVGGQFGLWLGLSIVTFVQTFYYIVLGVCRKREPVQQKYTISSN